ncbi:MAG: Alpha-D-kanosaminyltransferase [Chlamydiae bacterium]|nr:Alpha-D-kanosaminyltransferase [Chlamydiota bacterium]
MTKQTLIIKHRLGISSHSQENETAIDWETLKEWCMSGKIFYKFRSYGDVIFCTVDSIPKYRRAFLLGLCAYFLKTRKSTIKYGRSEEVNISLSFLLKRTFILVRDLLRKPFFLKSLNKTFAQLHQNTPNSLSLPLSGNPYYFRTDFLFHSLAGGPVAHISGVLNTLEEEVGTPPIFLTSAVIPTVREKIRCHLITPEDKFLDYADFSHFAFSETYSKKAIGLLEKHPPRFIYERYSIGSISGVELSQKFQVPFVLEYNSSKIWIAKHWGEALKHEKLFLTIEELNFHAAQLIVVVSEPLKEQLILKGVDEEKILVNPNGVDPEKYSPTIDGTARRNELKLAKKIVVGFVGTFGKCHGAEVLAESFGTLIKRYPEYRDKVHLIMIGDGVTMPLVVEMIKEYHIEDYVTLTGLVPQAEAPHYLAACDILVSPQVPNGDGSKFFCSPIKVFEYMAMGRGIVASDLDQIGEVLDHKKTAFLVKPGNQEALLQGLRVLIDNPQLRNELGRNAREKAVKNHTWKEHTHKMIKKLNELCPPALK